VYHMKMVLLPSTLIMTLLIGLVGAVPAAAAHPRPAPPSLGSVISPGGLRTPAGTAPAAITCGGWYVAASPSPGLQYNNLEGVAAVSSSDVWAVGYADSGPLIEQWNGTSWNVVSSPNPSSTSTLSAVAAVSASDVWAVGTTTAGSLDQTLIEQWNGTSWSIIPSPNTGSGGNELYGVAAVSADDVWAVGTDYSYGAAQTLIEQWNGTSWSIIPSPNVASGNNELYGVAAVSADDVWAVGHAAGQTLIEQWNGTSWSIISSPNLGTEANSLYGVAAVSANDVWAVGQAGGQALAEQWNGTSWNIVSGLGNGTLLGVAAISATDVWAVGYSLAGTLVEQWNGTNWTVASSPNPGAGGNQLNAVAAVLSMSAVVAVGNELNSGGNLQSTLIEYYCPPPPSQWTVIPSPNPGATANYLYGTTALAANNALAVGYDASSNGVDQTLAEQWDGINWTVIPSPSPGTSINALLAVAGVPGTTNTAWAVGTSLDSSGVYQTLIEQWNGTSWSIVPSPNVGSVVNVLEAVRAVSATDVWAVGYFRNTGGSPQTLTEQWNGTSWNVISSPNVGSGSNVLYGVAAPSANAVWAVGYSRSANGTTQTLAEGWNGTSWTIASSPDPSSTSNTLLGVTAVNANDVWAVGSEANSSTTTQTLTEQWNGSKWSLVTSPGPGTATNSLDAATVSAGNVWAVGNDANASSGPYQTLIEEWNGTSWTVVSSPSPGAVDNYLYAVAPVPNTSTLWAVGMDANASSGPYQTLTEEYQGAPTTCLRALALMIFSFLPRTRLMLVRVIPNPDK
jgi:hypothetical protein